MISHFDESIMTGTLAMSGSPAHRLRKRRIAATPSSMPSSMLTSTICAPFSDLLRQIQRGLRSRPRGSGV